MSSVLDVLISPTTRCNLRCRYCYVNQDAASACADMNIDDLRAAYRWLSEYAKIVGVNTVRITWFGGEPLLLGVGFLELAVAGQRIFAENGINCVNTIQTNLTLVNDEHARLFKESFDEVGFSLDFGSGWRVFPNGASSLGCVEEKVRVMKAAGVPIGAVCTLTRANSGMANRIYQYFKSIGVNFKVNRAASSPDMAKAGLLLSVSEYEREVIDICDEYLADECPTIRFDNLSLMIRAWLTAQTYVCTDTERPECYIAIEARGRVLSRCRFRGEFGNYHRDPPQSVVSRFRRVAFRPQRPNACATCEFWGKVCRGPCFGEQNCDCNGSDCGYRTEVTAGLWRYVRELLDVKGLSFGCKASRQGV